MSDTTRKILTTAAIITLIAAGSVSCAAPEQSPDSEKVPFEGLAEHVNERHGFKLRYPVELDSQANYRMIGFCKSSSLSLKKVEWNGQVLTESMFNVFSAEVREGEEFRSHMYGRQLIALGEIDKILIDGVETTIYGYKTDFLDKKDVLIYYAHLQKDNIRFHFEGREEYFKDILATFEFIDVVLPKKTAAPFVRPENDQLLPEVKNWLENSLKFELGHFANAKEHSGKQYLFVRSGTMFGFERLAEISAVTVVEQEEVVVEVRFTKPSLNQQITGDLLYDLAYIEATGLPVRFIPSPDDGHTFITTLDGIHYLPDIVADSRDIKVFTPSPYEAVGRKFRVTGAYKTFEYEFHHRLFDAAQKVLASGYGIKAKSAPGFTRAPVVPCLMPWKHFTFDVVVPETVEAGENLTLLLFGLPASVEEGYRDDPVEIPLKFEPR